ncbi:lipoate--protein ligase family protein [Candidatus Bipolaricaulota bacterium]|nr:lipoate--protein ligase family protein [Candidatus Bipolaricaulota bacterium]
MLRLIIDLDPIDPSLGLALEEALLESTRHGHDDTLRMWVNHRSVIVGRSQSVASEVDLEQLRSLAIPVVRRISGGGAVYHYPGNLNVSLFMKDGGALGTASEAYAAIGRAVVDVLSEYDIDAHVKGNIIIVGEKKIAGAAQVRRGRNLLYHMSLLVSPSQIPIDNLLLAMQGAYEPVLVASHPRPVTSLSQLSSSLGMQNLIEIISRSLADLLREDLEQSTYSREEMKHAGRLRATKYGSEEWNLSR